MINKYVLTKTKIYITVHFYFIYIVFVYGVKCHFQHYFSYILAVSFI